MNSKTAIASAALVAVSIYCAVLFNKNSSQQEQLADYRQHVDQLLSQIEDATVDRLSLQQQLQQLENNIVTQNSRFSSVSQQLNDARKQISPDYQQIESDLRQRLTREISQELQAANESPLSPRLNLLKQFNELAADEFRQLMSLQAQFGGYLQSLDISDERMEVVVDALSNMIEEQNQITMDFVSQMQTGNPGQAPGDDFNPLAMRRQIMEINSTDSQIETLSYSLNQQELDAFSEYRAAQQNQEQQVLLNSFPISVPASGRAPSVFIGTGQDGSFRAQAIQIAPAPDSDQSPDPN